MRAPPDLPKIGPVVSTPWAKTSASRFVQPDDPVDRLAKLYVGETDLSRLAAEIEVGTAEARRDTGFTYYSLFHGGVDAPTQAWEPLNCTCVGGCDSQPEAQVLFKERTGLESGKNFFQLKPSGVPVHDVLCSGSPCQTFSPLGKQQGLEEIRGRLYVKQLNLVARMAESRRPLIILLEQVPNVLHVDEGRAQKLLLRKARQLGYEARQQIVDSNEFGSASRRVRLFTTLVRKDVVAAVGFPDPPTRPTGRRRVMRDVIKPLQTRPAEHVLSRTGWTGATVETRKDYYGPVVVGLGPGPAPGNHAYSLDSPAPTQRATGRRPTGVYYQEGSLVTLTPRESARCMDIDDSVDIGERWGESLAQQFVGNSMSVFVMRAFGETFKTTVAAWHGRATADAPDLRETTTTYDDPDVCPPCETGGATRRDLPTAEDFLRRHDDHCPIWCTDATCRVCDRFSWSAGRKLVYFAWLRKLRREWPSVAERNCANGSPVPEARLRKDFFQTVRLWHARLYDINAGTRLIWWHWPTSMQTEIREGVDLGFLEPPDSGFRPNHPSGEHLEVGQELDRFFKCGYVEHGPIVSQSPLAYVPKRAAGIGRVIYNMKCSRVNRKLPGYPVAYPRINDVMRNLYPNAWFFETDFIDHFYHFRVRPSDRKHLGVRRPFGKGYYRFTTLPMGCATSPYHCSRLTYAWEDCLSRLPPYVGKYKLNLPGLSDYDPAAPYLRRVDNRGETCATDSIYVDDVHGMAPSRDACVAALRILMISAGSHGFGIKYKKVKGPAQHDRAFNGFTIDSRPEHGGPKVNPSNEKRDQALILLETLLSERRADKQNTLVGRRRLAQVVGLLQSLVPGVPHGNTFLRRLYDSVHCLHLAPAQRPGTDYDVQVMLDDEHWKDVQWWVEVLRLHEGTRLLCNRDVRTRAHFTDGSGRGTGGTAQDFGSEALPRISFFTGTWRRDVTSMSSNWKELKSILIALRRERLSAEKEGRPSHLRRARIYHWCGEATSMTSNWKELRSILLALRRERQQAERQGRRSALWRTRIYHFTDNVVSESILTKGASSSPKLQQLLREIAYEQQLQQCDVTPIHVAGKRLIAQGTDGLSRGQTRAGALSGTTADVNTYNSLVARPQPVPMELRAWAAQRWPSQAYLQHPDQWDAGHVRGADTLWMPPPTMARQALLAFLRQRMIAPTTTAATFLLPRRYTAPWRRLLRQFTVSTVRAGDGPHWPTGEFEPLLVARCEPWIPLPPKAKTKARSSIRSSAPTSRTRTSASAAGNTSSSTTRCAASTRTTRSSRRTSASPAPSRRVAASGASAATASRGSSGRRC